MMQRWILCGLLAGAGLAGGIARADDDEDADTSGGWYVSPMLQYDRLDVHRAAGDGLGGDVALGYNVVANFGIEFNYGYGDFGIPNAGHQSLQQFTLDGVVKFLPGSLVDPYFIGGAGVLDDRVSKLGLHHSAAAEAGFGALTGLGSQLGWFRMQLRTEAKYRREWIQNLPYDPKNPSDILFGVGVQFEFGAPPLPRPAVPAAAPPPPTPSPTHSPPPVPPPPDSDHDGVIDAVDRCPNTPPGDRVDAVGCTVKAEIKLPGVSFATNSAELTADSDPALSYAVTTLNKHPNLAIEVRGYTDDRGSAKYNQILSQRRAESVMRYLQNHGVTNPLAARGFGAADPIADNSTEHGRMANRRVVLHSTGR